MRVNLGQLVGCAVLGVVLAGCATRQSRLEKYANVFAGFPPEVQENVRKTAAAVTAEA